MAAPPISASFNSSEKPNPVTKFFQNDLGGGCNFRSDAVAWQECNGIGILFRNGIQWCCCSKHVRKRKSRSGSCDKGMTRRHE